MVKELTYDNLCALTGDCLNNNKHHHLTFGDVTRMDCIIEHDRMLYNGWDRQICYFQMSKWTSLNLFNLVRMLGGLFLPP